MVVGSGLVGKTFKEKYDVNNEIVIFASGVSNSKCEDKVAFNREINLIENSIKNNSTKTFVYFSTCSIYDEDEKQSSYILHKKKIERYIIDKCTNWYIFRVSNIIGKTDNNFTFFNFFINAIKNNISFNLWGNATRNIIDIEDVFLAVDYIVGNKILKNSIINLANPQSTPVLDIVKTIEKALNKKGNYTLVKKGKPYNIDTSVILPYYKKLNQNFGPQYLSLLLNKYYAKDNDL